MTRRPARREFLRRLGRVATLVPGLLVGGCSAVDVLNAAATRDGYVLDPDLPYGDGARRRLDVYRPDRPGARPLVVFFYGGEWQAGDRADYRFVGAALAARGAVTVIPDYRVWPEAGWRDILADGAAALDWAATHAPALGADPGRIYLMGHSAGAWLALMLALGHGGPPLAGAIGLAGPYDFLPLRSATLRAIFAPESTIRETQPISYARGDAPPLLLATGDADAVVDPGNAGRLAAAVTARGGAAEIVTYPRIGHREIVGALAPELAFLAPVRRDVLGFIGLATSD